MERSGFKKIFYAPIKNNAYQAWVEIPDAEELTSSILGGTEPRYSGDRIAGVQETFKGEQLTLKSAGFNKDFKINCLGYIETSSGSLIKTEAKDKPFFALGYVEVVDGKDTIKVYPKCRAGMFAENAKTESNTPDYQTVELPIIAQNVEIGGKQACYEEGIEYTPTYFNNAYTLPTLKV